MLAWPALRTKRSRSGQSGCVGAWRRNLVHRTYAIGAAPIGAPGCPEFAFWTASIESVRMVSMASWSRSVATVIGRAPIGGLRRVGRLASAIVATPRLSSEDAAHHPTRPPETPSAPGSALATGTARASATGWRAGVGEDRGAGRPDA